MINNKKVTVVLPAYNAAKTLEKTIGEIPFEIVDDIILLYDRETNDFICQGNSLEQLAKLSKEYKKIEYASVKHGEYFVAFIEGKVDKEV